MKPKPKHNKQMRKVRDLLQSELIQLPSLKGKMWWWSNIFRGEPPPSVAALAKWISEIRTFAELEECRQMF